MAKSKQQEGKIEMFPGPSKSAGRQQEKHGQEEESDGKSRKNLLKKHEYVSTEIDAAPSVRLESRRGKVTKVSMRRISMQGRREKPSTHRTLRKGPQRGSRRPRDRRSSLGEKGEPRSVGHASRKDSDAKEP